jgi:hypothetical protein
MAFAHSRKIIVDGKAYRYRLDGWAYDRYGLGWTPGTLTLLFQEEDGIRKFSRYECKSKHWTSAHAEIATEGPRCGSLAPDHKVPFPPSVVANVIRHGFAAELVDWRVNAP